MKTLHIVYISCFAAITAILGMIPPIPLASGVPITAQTLGVMLAGLLLGKKLGFLSLALFCILVMTGLPLLSGGRGGLAVLVSPTGGFFLGFPIAAYAIGWFREKIQWRYQTISLFACNVLGGIMILYLCGIPWLAWKLDKTLLEASIIVWIYLPGDFIKAVVASLLTVQIQKALPNLLK